MGLLPKIGRLEEKKVLKNSLSNDVIGVILSGPKKLQICRSVITSDNFQSGVNMCRSSVCSVLVKISISVSKECKDSLCSKVWFPQVIF